MQSFRPLKNITWRRHWLVLVLVMMVLFGFVVWQGFCQVRQQIIEANQQVAINNARIIALEVWLQTQIAYTQQDIRAKDTQADQQTPVQQHQ